MNRTLFDPTPDATTAQAAPSVSAPSIAVEAPTREELAAWIDRGRLIFQKSVELYNGQANIISEVDRLNGADNENVHILSVDEWGEVHQDFTFPFQVGNEMCFYREIFDDKESQYQTDLGSRGIEILQVYRQTNDLFTCVIMELSNDTKSYLYNLEWNNPNVAGDQHVRQRITTEFITAHAFEAVALMSAFDTKNRAGRKQLNTAFDLQIKSINGVVRQGNAYGIRSVFSNPAK